MPTAPSIFVFAHLPNLNVCDLLNYFTNYKKSISMLKTRSASPQATPWLTNMDAVLKPGRPCCAITVTGLTILTTRSLKLT